MTLAQYAELADRLDIEAARCLAEALACAGAGELDASRACADEATSCEATARSARWRVERGLDAR